MIGILVPIVFFIVIGFVLYYYLRVKHEEKMRIIEKGLSAEEIKYLFDETPQKSPSPLRNAKWGIILISIGLAIIIGMQMDYAVRDEMTIGFIFLFPGLGLLLYYGLFGRKELKQIQKQDEHPA